MENNKQKNIEALLLFISVVAGFRVVFSKLAINNGFGPYTITAAQFLIGGVILTIYLRGELLSINKKYFFLAIFASAIFFLAFYFGTLGLLYTTPSKNVFLQQTSIVFIPFLYYFVYKQKIDMHTIIGVGVAIIGLAFLTLDDGFSNVNIGDILSILAAIMIAIHMTFSSFILKKNECDPVVFMTVQMFVAGIAALVLALVNETFSNGLNLTIAWPLLLGGILNGLCFYVNSLGFKYTTPTKMSVICAVTPIASTVTSILFLNEVITYRLFVGGGLILIALLIMQIKPKLATQLI